MNERKQTKAWQDKRRMNRVGVVGYNKAELRQSVCKFTVFFSGVKSLCFLI